MRSKARTEPDHPTLIDRLLESRCTRIAVVGLHPGAGARVAVQCLAADLAGRGVPFGVTRAPRAMLETEPDPAPPIRLPAGALVASGGPTPDPGTGLELLERLREGSAADVMSLMSVCRDGDFRIHGPDDPSAMSRALERLCERGARLCLVDGEWGRRGFAAPGVTHAIVLVVGSGFSSGPERSAAAARYMVDVLRVPPCDVPARRAWEEASARGTPVALDRSGRMLGYLRPTVHDPVSMLADLDGAVATVALPNGLHDGFLRPLIRSPFQGTIVVRDPTRIHVAPVYYKAWLKGKGAVRVARPARVVAIATNPVNPSGPDADPELFRRLVAEALPELPVHDVRLEDGTGRKKPRWKFWE